MRLPGMKKYITARAIIIQDDKMLAFYRRKQNRETGNWIEYFSIPGGEIDEGETPEQAVIRELKEEMGVTIEPIRLVAHDGSNGFEHYVFSARIISGEPVFMSDSQEAVDYQNKFNTYQVVWVHVKSLNKENLNFYAPFYDQIIECATENSELTQV